jgi:hypothetical protein
MPARTHRWCRADSLTHRTAIWGKATKRAARVHALLGHVKQAHWHLEVLLHKAGGRTPAPPARRPRCARPRWRAARHPLRRRLAPGARPRARPQRPPRPLLPARPPRQAPPRAAGPRRRARPARPPRAPLPARRPASRAPRGRRAARRRAPLLPGPRGAPAAHQHPRARPGSRAAAPRSAQPRRPPQPRRPARPLLARPWRPPSRRARPRAAAGRPRSRPPLSARLAAAPARGWRRRAQGTAVRACSACTRPRCKPAGAGGAHRSSRPPQTGRPCRAWGVRGTCSRSRAPVRAVRSIARGPQARGAHSRARLDFGTPNCCAASSCTASGHLNMCVCQIEYMLRAHMVA